MEKFNKNSPKGRRVGLIYDERMCGHKNPKGYHPENPNRIRVVWERLNESGVAKRCVVSSAKEAEDDQLALVHSKEHIDLIKTISSTDFRTRSKRAKKFDSIYFNKGSSKAAYLAAGSVIKAAEKVAKGELDSAFAIVRPPGHHAEEDEPMGFCLYNNVAIAASFLLNERPELGIRKILIVDWDVHHGNSTQKMFYQDPRVLFFSVHRHESGNFYPYNNDGSYNMIGEGSGVGYNINVPWENGMCGDADYFAVWDHILILVAEEFDPDMIIISAGFDAVLGDPIGGCCVSPNGYSIMLDKLMDFAKGKIVMALEGGYDPTQLANSAQACIEVLLETKPLIRSLEDCPLESTWPVIQAVRQALRVYWPVLATELPDEVINSPSSQIGVGIGVGHVPKEANSHTTSLQANTEFPDNSFDPDRSIENDDESSTNELRRIDLIHEAERESSNPSEGSENDDESSTNELRTRDWILEAERESSNPSEGSENEGQSTAARGAWELDKAKDDKQFNQLQIRYDNWHCRRNSRSWELASWVEWHEEEDWVFEFTEARSVEEAMDTTKFQDILRRKRLELIRYKEELRSKGKEAAVDIDGIPLGRKDGLNAAQAYENDYQEQNSAQVYPTWSPGEDRKIWPTVTRQKRARAGPSYTSPCRKVRKGLFSFGMNPLDEVDSFRDTTETSLLGPKMREDDIKSSIMRSTEEFEAQLNRSRTKMEMLFSNVYVNGVQHEVHATRAEALEKISKDELTYLRKKNKQLKAVRDRAEKALDHEITTGQKFLESEFGKELLKKAKNDAVNELKSEISPNITNAFRLLGKMESLCQRHQ